jgi:arylsulfatase A-like enzyme
MKLSKITLTGICATLAISVFAQKNTQPNIVILLADDLGHGDLSCTGGKTPTPNIDRIFKQGVVFNNFMTCPVSTPTRAGLLTAIHPLRIGQGPETGGNMDVNLVNLGNFFQKEGYRTGIFGKWHNSDSPNMVEKANTVNQYGFDRFVGFYAGALDYYSKGSTGWFHDDKLIENEGEYMTDLNSKYALEFMAKSRLEKKPFVCYVPFGAVHGPHVVKEELLKRVPAEIMSKVKDLKPYEYYRRAVVNMQDWRKFNATYYKDDSWLKGMPKLSPEETAMLYSAMITSLDDNVGVVMDYLKKNKLLENTIVLFFSDNGGTEYAGNNSPFSGFKHSLLEGGIHAAAAMMIPKKVIPVTVKEVNPMCGYLDVLPTMVELSKSKQNLPKNIDGVSLVNQINGKITEQSNRYYWAWREHDVIRSDKWKLFRYIDKVLLYDMVNDIAEKNDISKQNPEKVKQLLAQMNLEAKKNGAAYSHFALMIEPSKPAPSGNVIALNIVSDEVLSKQKLQILNFEFPVMPDQYLDYDIMIDSTANLSNAYFSIFRNGGIIFESNGVNTDEKLLRLSPNVISCERGCVASPAGRCGSAQT